MNAPLFRLGTIPVRVPLTATPAANSLVAADTWGGNCMATILSGYLSGSARKQFHVNVQDLGRIVSLAQLAAGLGAGFGQFSQRGQFNPLCSRHATG